MKISNLAQVTTINDEDVFPVVQGGETKKVTAKQLLANQPTDIAVNEKNEMQLMAGEKQIGVGVKLPYIDQTYSATSENAQSGVAVAEAIEQTQNIYANALKGYASGSSIALNDVSPLEHKVKVKVEGKNLTPFVGSYNNGKYVSGETYVISGVSFTVNDDGSVYAVGTAETNGSVFILHPALDYSIGDKTATLSGSPEGASAKTYFVRLKKGASSAENYEDYGNGITINNVDLTSTQFSVTSSNNKTKTPE